MNKDGMHANLLRSHGLRATPQRLALMGILARARHPMSITELAALQNGKALDTTTFYRGLETLLEAGIVKKVNLQHEHADYELVRDHHHHLVCTDCEKIEDIDWCPAPGLPTRVIRESSFKTIDDHAVEFFGLCKACA